MEELWMKQVVFTFDHVICVIQYSFICIHLYETHSSSLHLQLFILADSLVIPTTENHCIICCENLDSVIYDIMQDSTASQASPSCGNIWYF